MRLNNKILIEGDTLKIFEEIDTYNGFKVGDFVKIDPNAAQQSGLDPNKSYEIQRFVDYGKGMSKSINAVLDKELYKPHIYPPKGIISVKFITKELNEENMSIENYKVGDILKFKDGEEWKVVKAGMRASDSRVKPDEITIAPYNQLAKDRNISLPIDINLDYLKNNLNEENTLAPNKLVPGTKYLYTGGAEYMNVTYIGLANNHPELKAGSSMGKGFLFQWPDSKYFELGPLSIKKYIEPEESINEAKEKKTPADKKKADKTNYGQKDIADVDMVNPYELRKGIRIEMVDTDDYEKAMDKAVKKLKKDPIYYSNLIANSKETKGKRSDVPTEVKDKKLNKVSDKLKDKANEISVSKKDAAKKNANDSLNKKEKASGKPKGVKEMTMKPKASKGMKSMSVPGKEKKTNLKESFNLWESFKKNILR